MRPASPIDCQRQFVGGGDPGRRLLRESALSGDHPRIGNAGEFFLWFGAVEVFGFLHAGSCSPSCAGLPELLVTLACKASYDPS